MRPLRADSCCSPRVVPSTSRPERPATTVHRPMRAPAPPDARPRTPPMDASHPTPPSRPTPTPPFRRRHGSLRGRAGLRHRSDDLFPDSPGHGEGRLISATCAGACRSAAAPCTTVECRDAMQTLCNAPISVGATCPARRQLVPWIRVHRLPRIHRLQRRRPRLHLRVHRRHLPLHARKPPPLPPQASIAGKWRGVVTPPPMFATPLSDHALDLSRRHLLARLCAPVLQRVLLRRRRTLATTQDHDPVHLAERRLVGRHRDRLRQSPTQPRHAQRALSSTPPTLRFTFRRLLVRLRRALRLQTSPATDAAASREHEAPPL